MIQLCLRRCHDTPFPPFSLCCRSAKNSRLLNALRQDVNSAHLFKACKDDIAAGRMSRQVLYRRVCFHFVGLGAVSRLENRHQLCLDLITLSPRFAVEQGLKPDGSMKIRPVDDFSRSGCNAAAEPRGTLVYESIDKLLASAREFKKCHEEAESGSTQLRRGELGPPRSGFALWKADIDSAYRRIPIAPEHRHLAWVAFVHDGIPMAAKHTTMPFGSVASVYHWDRVGELIKTIARCDVAGVYVSANVPPMLCTRRLFHLPVLRFVDDFFAVEYEGEENEAMRVFARCEPESC